MNVENWAESFLAADIYAFVLKRPYLYDRTIKSRMKNERKSWQIVSNVIEHHKRIKFRCIWWKYPTGRWVIQFDYEFRKDDRKCWQIASMWKIRARLWSDIDFAEVCKVKMTCVAQLIAKTNPFVVRKWLVLIDLGKSWPDTFWSVWFTLQIQNRLCVQKVDFSRLLSFDSSSYTHIHI